MENVIRWLMEIEIQEQVAVEVTRKSQVDDIAEWKQAALKLAFQKQSTTMTEDKNPISEPAVLKTSLNNEKKQRKMYGLLKVIEGKKKDKKETFYSLLKKAGVVQDVRSTLRLE
ncbi:hypothetical protein [Paenibacillus sp. FSL L8-0709]|uniref:hypothetical protein n=1 Tax=Paenibacillus sp. FSL L8-0709 TaxID=2975312 RepID=UPI0030F9423E